MTDLIYDCVIAIILLIAFFLLLFIRKSGKNKTKWGINLKRVYCPTCNTKQPFIRIPDSFSQAMRGGTTCPKCHTHLDKYGDMINTLK